VSKVNRISVRVSGSGLGLELVLQSKVISCNSDVTVTCFNSLISYALTPTAADRLIRRCINS